jgi:hypothetical protein
MLYLYLDIFFEVTTFRQPLCPSRLGPIWPCRLMADMFLDPIFSLCILYQQPLSELPPFPLFSGKKIWVPVDCYSDLHLAQITHLANTLWRMDTGKQVRFYVRVRKMAAKERSAVH